MFHLTFCRMGKQPFISHVVNGYSRYDVPESKAFTCTPGVLYPVRIDFINTRDRITLAQGIDVRSNPLAVPTFNPYVIRLHRFWVPLQLYHPEMRTNSSKFDMNKLSTNWIPHLRNINTTTEGANTDSLPAPYTNSLMSWLRLGGRPADRTPGIHFSAVQLPAAADFGRATFNADPYLAYWDIVRNFYAFSQWSVFSFVWPTTTYPSITYTDTGSYQWALRSSKLSRYFSQCWGNLEFLDTFYETQFYPNSVDSSNNTYNRSGILPLLIYSDLDVSGPSGGVLGDGSGISSYLVGGVGGSGIPLPLGQFSTVSTAAAGLNGVDSAHAVFSCMHPMAVSPSSPDRYSRLLPPGSSDSDVPLSGVTSIPQLAIASRLQEYKDLLGAGGSRFSDWLETFFASRIEHVDRPKLLFSASQVINIQVVMNQAGSSQFAGDTPLGSQGGAIAFNSELGRRQSYYFKEPGYLIDMFSIRPVYYWSGVYPDYLSYEGADYFNPIYNDIGYQDVPTFRLFSGVRYRTYAQEPCFNEFRASYDEVLGNLQAVPTTSGLYRYWVQQRYLAPEVSNIASLSFTPPYKLLFVDMSTVNDPFASQTEDNFIVNMSYSVRRKNLVNKTFATRLSNR